MISGFKNWLVAQSVRFAPRRMVTAIARKTQEAIANESDGTSLFAEEPGHNAKLHVIRHGSRVSTMCYGVLRPSNAACTLLCFRL